MKKNLSTLSDTAVLAILGERLAHDRLQQNLTQAQLAKESGVSKRTIERLEAGESVQLTNFLRVLRVFGRINGLDSLLPPPMPSPMEQLRLQGKQRQRASSSRKSTAVAEPEGVWHWGDNTPVGHPENHEPTNHPIDNDPGKL